MNLTTILLLIGTAGLGGIVFGYFLRWIISLGRKGSIELEIKQSLLDAKVEGQKITEAADREGERVRGEAKRKLEEREGELKKTEERLVKKDETLDRRQADLDRELEGVKRKIDEVKNLKEGVEKVKEEAVKKKKEGAGLTRGTAKERLIAEVEAEHEEDLKVRLQKLEAAAGERLERKAKDILANIIQRLAVSTVSETMSTAIALPSDDLKGKIIGKEGRNIRAFERATGVEVLIDDTPGTIVLSAFDPVRRATAKRALEHLIADGRIQQ